MYRIFSVTIRAANGRYVSDVGDGYGSLRATAETAGSRETFEINDFNGGSLEHGDVVRIKAAGGYVQTVQRNRPWVADDTCACSPAGLFVIESVGGAASTTVSLASVPTGQYVSLDPGRGADMVVNQNAVGVRERLVLSVK
jgi:chitinase